MKTHLKNQKFSLFSRNFVYLEIGAGQIESSEKPEGKEAPTNPIDYYKENKERLEKGVDMTDNIASTLKLLANNNEDNATQINTRYMEGYEKNKTNLKIYYDIINAQQLWDRVKEEGATKVKIVEQGDLWIFRFEDDAGTDILKKMEKDRTAVPVDVPGNPFPVESSKKAKKPTVESSAEKRARGNRRKAEAAREKAQKRAAVDTLAVAAGREDAESNDDYKLDKSILKLIDNERLWMDAWQNPGSVTGMRELKTAITQAFPHLKSADQVRKALRKAIGHGSLTDRLTASSHKSIDFEDLIEGLGEASNPLRLPSWATPVSALGKKDQERIDNSPSLTKNAQDIERYMSQPEKAGAEYVMAQAYGFAYALEAIPNTDCKLTDANKEKVTLLVTSEGHAYYVTILKNGDTHIYNYPNKTPYKDNDGYNNSHNFDSDTLLGAFDGRPRRRSKIKDQSDRIKWNQNKATQRSYVANWFQESVKPSTTSGIFKDGRDHLLATYKKLFNADGSPKERTKSRPDIIAYYNNLFGGSHRVLSAISRLKYNPQEAAKIEQEKAYDAGLREAARKNATPVQRFADGITNLDAAEMATGNGFWSMREQLAKFDGGSYETVTNNTGNLLHCLPTGTNAIVIGPDLNKERGKGVPYIKLRIKTPEYRAVTVTVKDYPLTNAVHFENNAGEKMHKEWRSSNLESHAPVVQREYLDALTKLGMRETTWHDVMEGSKVLPPNSRLHSVMSADFADAALEDILKKNGAIDKNGQYNEAKALQVFANLATKGLRNLLSIAYPETHDDKEVTEIQKNTRNKMAAFRNTLGTTYKVINTETQAGMIENITAADLQDPKKVEALQELIRNGLIIDLADQEQEKQNNIQAELTKQMTEFRNSHPGYAEAIAEIKKEYAAKGKKPPADLEQQFEQKVFPLIFAFGADLTTGVVGPGIGTGIDIPIAGGDGGTIHLGGGIGAGLDIAGENAGKAIALGPAIGGGYTTPKWGILSISVGAGAGLNLLDGEFGGALGGMFNFDVGGSRFNHTLSFGGGIIAGAPALGGFFTVKPNHEYRQDHMWEDAQFAFGLENDNPSMQDIAANKGIARLILSRNANIVKNLPPNATAEQALQAIGEEKVKADYKAIKEDLHEKVLLNYDPSKAYSGAAFGVGYDFENGRMIVGFAPNFVDYSAKKVQLRSNKTAESMGQEISLEQSFQIIEQIKKNGKLSPAEEKKWTERGALLRLQDGSLSVLVPNSEARVPAPRETAEVNSMQTLEAELNRIYKPLGLQVKYDPTEKMFELGITNKNGETNYEVAMSPTLLNEGIIMKGNKLYINSSFSQNNTLTIRRSDFRYPFPKEGKHTHTLITVSADPGESPTSIYANSAKVLHARGTATGGLEWQEASGPDQFGTDITKPQTQQTINEAQFQREHKPLDYVDNAQEAKYFAKGGVWDKQTMDQLERGPSVSAEREKAISNFAENIMGEDGTSGRFAVKYRKMSTNIMMLDDKNPELLKAVQDEWKIDHPEGPALSDIEMQKALNHLSNLSFKPLKGETPEERRKALDARLKSLRLIIERQYKKDIEKNHKNHPSENDPYRIKSTAKQLTDYVLERAYSTDIENPNHKINISQLDRYMSVAATMGIHGNRDAGLTRENTSNPLYSLHRIVKNELTFPLPSDAPQVMRDLVNLGLEGLSPLPDIRDGSLDKLKEFKSAPLTLSVFSLMQEPESGLMFGSHPEYRYAIAEFMEDDDMLFIGEAALGLPGAAEKKERIETALGAFNTILTRIREAEYKGQKEVASPYNGNFIFTVNLEIKDGLYERCKNYTMWVNERIGAKVKIPTRPTKQFAGYAGYGKSTASTDVAGITQPSTMYKIAVAAAAKVKPEPDIPPPPPGTKPGDPNAGSTGRGSGDSEGHTTGGAGKIER